MNYMKEVKFLDLKAQYPLIREEINKKFEEIINNSAFVAGKNVKEFEQKFSEYLGVKNCITVNNGTAALYLPLLAMGISPGDEVIIPINTFFATAEAVSLLGAKPVFVDMDEVTYLIDTTKIEAKITPRTKGIIPVHLYGQCADMDAINAIANKHNLFVLEDCCQAHGASYKGKRAGTFGKLAAFSFYPGKNLGAWGEGGSVVTNDDSLADKIRLLRDHGSRIKYRHDIVGGNFRIDEFQGAVLAVKLPHLENWNSQRRENAKKYLAQLANVKNIMVPRVLEKNVPVWHLFVIRSSMRDGLMNFLKEKGVQTGMHYPTPLHLTIAYADLGYKLGDFPVAEKVQSEILSLPMYAELSGDDINYVAECIKEFNH